MRKEYRGKWYVDPSIELYNVNDRLIGLRGWNQNTYKFEECIELDQDYKTVLMQDIIVQPIYCEEELIALIIMKEE